VFFCGSDPVEIPRVEGIPQYQIAEEDFVKGRTQPAALTDPLFALSGVAVAEIDLETHRFVRASARFCELTGYGAAELRQMTQQALTVAEDYAREEEFYRDILLGHRGDYSIDKRYVHKTGRHVWVKGTSSVVRDQSGQRTSVLVLAHDIADDTQAVERLQAAAERLRLIIDSAPVFIAYCDRDERFRFVNKAYADRFGLHPSEVVGKTIAEIVGVDAYESFRHYVAAALAGQRVEFELEVPYEKIGCLYMWCVYVPQIDESGESRGFVAVITDITGRRRIEKQQTLLADAGEALAVSLDLHKTLQGVLDVMVDECVDWAVIDLRVTSGEVQRVAVSLRDISTGALRRHLTEAADRHASTSTAAALSSGQSRLVATAADDDAADLGSTLTVPLRARGTIVGALTWGRRRGRQPLDSQDLALAAEIGRRLAVHSENARLYEEAKEANRVKDEFLAMLSHELRTPLNAIVGWISMMSHPSFDPALLDHAIDVISRSARAQVQIVDELLDLSRIVKGGLPLDMKPIPSLAGIVATALESIRPAAEAKQIQLTQELDGAAGPVLGDPARMQQIVWNLVSNAVKFTPAGGAVHVQLVRIAGHVQLLVRDTGIGIRKEMLRVIFERFRQADSSTTRQYAGLGLGLAIVRELVHLHGGTVEAHSGGEGKGASFLVQLPVLEGAGRDRREPSAKSSQERASLADIQVLLVEDDVDSREFCGVALTAAGARVDAAGSVREAMEAFDSRRPSVVLADIGLPGEDGYALVRQIRQRDRSSGGHTPTIALTGYAQSQDRARVLAAGFDWYLSKPIDMDQLVKTVADVVIAGKRPPAQA
jgi:PAS domain S-box-containing protein